MSLIRTLHILTSVVFVCLFLCELCASQGNARRRQRIRNSQRRDQAELPNGLHQAYYGAFENVVSTPSPPFRNGPVGADSDFRPSIGSRNNWNSNWDRFTPSTPSSNNVDCYVEVSTVQFIGGICTQLGGNRQPYICQSGQHFEFKPECRQIVRHRQAQQQQQQQQQQQPSS